MFAAKNELDNLRGKERSKAGIFSGDLKNGEMEVGQAASRISEILPAGEIVNRMVMEYSQVINRLVDLQESGE